MSFRVEKDKQLIPTIKLAVEKGIILYYIILYLDSELIQNITLVERSFYLFG